MFFLSKLTDVIKDAAVAGVRSLCASLCQAIYPIIAFAYELFMKLATYSLWEPTKVTKIYGRVTMVLTIVMVFYVIFEFIKYLVQPDTMTDKERGIDKLPLRMIAVVVLIAFTPSMFEYANKLQTALIKNETISKVILNKKYSDDDYDNFGRNFSWHILSMFYDVRPDAKNVACYDNIPCSSIVLMNAADLTTNGKLTYITLGINATGKVDKEIKDNDGTIRTEKVEVPLIQFEPLWAVLVGGFVAYILILYCVDVAARVIQLAYLGIIAPIPIIGILSPKKDNIFTKWLKQCAVTYLDVFIRMFIIYFILLMCDVLLNEEAFTSYQGDMKWAVRIALILGLLVFGKRVPKMITELLPKSSTAASGNFGLKPGERNLGKALGAALGLTAGTVIGAATGLAQGARRVKSLDPKATAGQKARALLTGSLGGTLRGGLGGAGRGLLSGVKKGNIVSNVSSGVKNQIKSNKAFGNRAESGYTLGHQLQDKLGETFGGGNRKEALEKQKAPLKRKGDALKEEVELNKSKRQRAEEKVREGKGRLSGALASAEKRVRDFKEDPSVKEQFRRTAPATEEEKAAARASVSREGIKTVAQSRAEAEAKFGKNKYGLTGDALYKKAQDEAATAARASVDRKKFTDDVGEGKKYATIAEAQAAYKTAQDEAAAAARDGVNRDDFKKYDRFDSEGYEKAKDEAAAAARARVDRSKFTDEASYIAAQNAAAEKAREAVDKDKFQRSYESEEAAQTAYERAQDKAAEKAREAVDMRDFISAPVYEEMRDADGNLMYDDDGNVRTRVVKAGGAFDEAAYKKAQDEAAEAARKAVNRDEFVVTYDSDEARTKAREADIREYMSEERKKAEEEYERRAEAAVAALDTEYDEAAFEAAYQEALKAADKAKKDAIDDYIDYGTYDESGELVRDAAIVSMEVTAKARREEYNRFSASEHRVPETVTVERGGVPVTVSVDDLTAAELDYYVKHQVKDAQDDCERRIIGIEAEAAAIERETAGSSGSTK